MYYIEAHKILNLNKPFARYGYEIYRGDLQKFESIKNKFSNYMESRLKDFGITTNKEFKLENYHELFKNDPTEHYRFIKEIKRNLPEEVISIEDPFILLILEKASFEFGKRAVIYDKKIEFRVVRPGHDDNNKLHRDHWFPYFRPLINIYIPLASSYCDSAMKVVPGSHLWSDEDVIPEFEYEGGKSINSSGVAYSVPGIKITNKEINPHRPDILPGDFMLFSPLSVHGGGDNFSNGTRFSFEIRIELID